MKLTVDVVSDVVCPWCFIGKRHLDAALELWREEQPACEVTVHWRPFFLNPDTPEAGEPYRPFLEKKFGGPEQVEELWQRVSAAGRSAGIAFAFEKIELRANTLNAHRLIHYAQSHTPEVGADGDPKVVQSKAILTHTSNRFLMSLKATNLKPSALPQVVCSSSRITRRSVDSICSPVMAWWRA